MKTLYTERGKIVVDDDTLSRISDAAAKVYQGTTQNNWREAIEIDIPKTTNRHWHPGHPTGQIMISISCDPVAKDNVHSQVMRALNGKYPEEAVSVDLGEYGYEGWETFIDFRDFMELPDFYFSRMFIHDTTETYLFRYERAALRRHLREIEEPHWKPFSLEVYKSARREIRSANAYTPSIEDKKAHRRYDRELAYLRNLASAARNFYKDGADRDQFEKAIRSKPRQR